MIYEIKILANELKNFRSNQFVRYLKNKICRSLSHVTVGRGPRENVNQVNVDRILKEQYRKQLLDVKFFTEFSINPFKVGKKYLTWSSQHQHRPNLTWSPTDESWGLTIGCMVHYA